MLAAPLTQESAGLLDARRIALLKPPAVVINVSRGALVDETALADALRDGRLRGAALDVFVKEPLPAASPLWGLENALLTPHTSPVSPGKFWPRALDVFLDNWTRYQRGEPLRNQVDKRAGY